MEVKMQQLKVTDNGFHQMCRLCLSCDINKTDIFLFSSEFEKKIADFIVECIPVQITRHDKMPTYICQSCFTQLKTFHQFQMQAVQSDRTLQHYLQQLSNCPAQIKIELDHEEPSVNFENRTSNADVKGEPFEIGDGFDISDSKQNVQEIAFKKETSFKSEIKEEPTDDESLSPTECVDTLQTLSKDGSSEDSVTAFDDAKIGVETPGNFECVTEKIFVKSEETYEYVPFKEGPENFKDVESVRFNEDNSNSSEHRSTSQKLNEKSRDFRKILKKSATSTESKSYQCDICQMRFSKSSNLKRHTLIHTGEKPYQCEICKMLFRGARNLKIHNLIHTGEKPYQCDICQMCFSKSSNLKRHKSTHTGEKPHQCDICKMYFGTMYTLKKHNLIHTGEKPYQCDVCQMCFRHTTSLKNHKLEHTGEKPYQCEICKMGFTNSSILKRHHLIHSEEKPYRCDICKMCFIESNKLKRHNLIHTGEKPYQCEVCKMCFRLPVSLKSHKLKHTGEKPYRCDICNVCFRQAAQLKSHKLKHAGEKPY